MATTIDSADEAGGEAIYTSDGLPTLVAPRAPKLISNLPLSGEDVLDTNDIIDPDTAAAIFAPSIRESTQAKLARLQREFDDLAKEMKGDDALKLASDFASQLGAIGGGINLHDDLSNFIKAYKMKEKDSIKGDQEGGIVYEIYSSSVPSSNPFEERISKLELLLGDKKSGNQSIFSRLQDLEQKLQRVDSKSLDDAATRAKAIRSDLEAAAKARSKLTSSTSTVDNKTIAELHAQLIQLEGISDHLPAITNRLQQLAHLHVASASFTNRLARSEEVLENIQGMVANLSGSLSKLEQGMADNLLVMDDNLRKLEERLA